MHPSSALCRAQEAHQNNVAAAATLDNVRVVALRAAAVWGTEALAAEKREARRPVVEIALEAEPAFG